MPPVMSSPAFTSALRVKRYFSSRLMLAAVMDNSGNVTMPGAAVSLHLNKLVRSHNRHTSTADMAKPLEPLSPGRGSKARLSHCLGAPPSSYRQLITIFVDLASGFF